MKKTVDQIAIQSYRLFYLADDHTNSVFEKVFICNTDVLKSIRYGLRDRLAVYGIIGPVREIRNFVAQCCLADGTGDSGMPRINFVGGDGEVIDLEHLDKNQKPSVYLMKLPAKPKQQKQTIFLAFVNKEQLYYEKPYDQKSLTYILLRFMGDLSNDIIILYNAKMLSEFTESDCPYSSTNSRFIEMKIEEASKANIKISEIPQCDGSDILKQFEKKYIDWKHSLVISQVCHLQYFQKYDEKEMEIKGDQDKRKRREAIWKRILEEGGLELEDAGVQEEAESRFEYREAVKELKNIHGRTKKEIETLAEKCYRATEHILLKQSQPIADIALYSQLDHNLQQLYFQTISKNEIQAQLKPPHFFLPKSQKILAYLTRKSMALVSHFFPELKDEEKEGKEEEIYRRIEELWEICWHELCYKVFAKFYDACQIVLELNRDLYIKKEKVEVVRFELLKTRKDNTTTKLEYKEQQKTAVYLTEIKKHVPSITLQQITDLKIFKARFLRECKVALISRLINLKQSQEGAQKVYEYILVVLERGEMKLIAKYVERQLVFCFDEKMRKVYLLKPDEKILTIFVLDQFQKSKNEKQYNLSKSRSNFQIISYSISKNPKQRLYYLDSRKDTLYCYDLSESSNKEYLLQDHSLTPLQGKYFQTVKAFNHNLYIALANSETVVVYQVNINGELSNAVVNVVVRPGEIFRGLGTVADQRNQYLIVYGDKKEGGEGEGMFRGFVFENMGSDRFIKQTAKKVSLGNPIIDIFYEANDRFGLYTTYTVCKNTPSPKPLHLHHILPQPSASKKVETYFSLLNLKNHQSHIYSSLASISKIFTEFGLNVSPQTFINQAQSRIPVQICSVESGNVIPLKDGNFINNFDGKEMAIERRCQALTFGIVERMLREDVNKRTIVVSIMGAQSTGKSYLLNRIFGTRFTVASCRTTIGIWASLIKTQTINFIILDCEGLFGIHRELNEEQKLIKILTSVSDFTILNLSKSMANKGLTELMINLSKSVEDKKQIKSKQLYNGDLVIVVRDVAGNEQQQIIEELNDNFHQNRGIKEFIAKLFNKDEDRRTLLIHNFPSFTESDSFAREADIMRRLFIERSDSRPIRNSETILDWIKIVLNQLACDDGNLPQEVMEKRIVELIQEKAYNAWRKGNQTFTFIFTILDTEISLQDSSIQLPQSPKPVSNQLQKFLTLLPQKLATKLTSVTFADAHIALNTSIIQFFDCRYHYTKKVLTEHVDGLSKKSELVNRKIEETVKAINDGIRKEKDGLRLCLKPCSPSCEQPCIKSHNHSSKIEQQIKSLNLEESAKQSWLKFNKLTPDEQPYRNEEKDNGIDRLKEQHASQIKEINNMLGKFEEINKLGLEIKDKEIKGEAIKGKIMEVRDAIQANKDSSKSLCKVLQNFVQIYQLYIRFLQEQTIKNSQQSIECKSEALASLQNVRNMLAVLQRNSFQDGPLQTQSIFAIYEELMKEKEEIEEIGRVTELQINQAISVGAGLKEQKEGIDQQLRLIQNMKQMAKLKAEEATLVSQLQRITQSKTQKQEQLSTLYKSLSSSIYKSYKPEQYIESQIQQLACLKMFMLQKCFKKFIMYNEELKQLFAVYEIEVQGDPIAAFEKRLEFRIARMKKKIEEGTENNLQGFRVMQEHKFVLEQYGYFKRAYEEACQEYMEKVKKFQSEFSFPGVKAEDRDKQHEQELNLVKFVCGHDEHEQSIRQYLGIFGRYFQYDLTQAWHKILKSFPNQQSQRLQENFKSPQQFHQALLSKNMPQVYQQIEQSKQKLSQSRCKIKQLEQEMERLQDMSLESSVEEEKNKASLIQSLILYDEILIKCERFCKLDCIGQFMRAIGYLGKQQKCEKESQLLKQEVIAMLKAKNPELIIKLNPNPKIPTPELSGEFTQSLQQITQTLESLSFKFQIKIFTHLQLYKNIGLQGTIKNLRKQIGHERLQLYAQYVGDLSQEFSDVQDAKIFLLKFSNKWGDAVEEGRGKGKDSGVGTGGKTIRPFHSLFLTVLTETWLQMCETGKKATKFLQSYEQSVRQLQAQLSQISQSQSILQSKLQKTHKQSQQIRMKSSTGQQPLILMEEAEALRQKDRMEAQLKDMESKLEILEDRRLFVRDFVGKIRGTRKEDITGIVGLYDREVSDNAWRYGEIVKCKQQQEELERTRKDLSQKLSTLALQTSEHSPQQLKKSLKDQQQKIESLTLLQKKIKQINQANLQLQSLQSQISTLKQSPQLSCSCETDHKCDRQCEIGCPQKSCLQKAGHKGKHACNDHQCGEKCQVNVKCTVGCNRVIGHPGADGHDCGEAHTCKQKCKYCRNLCRYSQFQEHLDHICIESRCPQKCIFCAEGCSSLAHNHDDEAEIITLIVNDKAAQKSKQIKKKLHLCSNSHTCQALCSHPGICSNTYQSKQKFWHQGGVDKKYDYIEQIEVKNKCSKELQPQTHKHEGECLCDCKHTCIHRCPDCRSLCQITYGHSESVQHETQHRNQESLIYAAERDDGPIIVSENNQNFIFGVGDISEPWKCDRSCQRKGRGHYHLIQCPGGLECYEKKLIQGAKHSTRIYKPNIDKKYDMLLCHKYWQIHNFKPPIWDPELRKCNFACTIVEDHKDRQNIFCRLEAWHSMSTDRRQHEFTCDHKRLLINAIEVCFLIDISGSMYEYSKICMQTIEKIIRSSSKSQIAIKFAAVGYRDHRMSESPLFEKLKKMCVEKRKALADQPLTNELSMMMTQSTFEQSLFVLQRKYNGVKDQPNLLQKFTQHEKLILKYHYPFVLDLKSSRRFLDQKRREKGNRYRILRNEQQIKINNLKQILDEELRYYLRQMEEEVKDQILNLERHPLKEIQNFTTSEQCLKFLGKLEAAGGGDPPEAVLDGMAAVAQLKWSSNSTTMRYIFHLFDAPPHGQQFDTNNEDLFPQGCPCKINLTELIEKLMKTKVNYIIYPFTNRVNKTLQVFRSKGLKFDVKDLKNVEEFTEHASMLICKQIQQTQIVIRKN